MKVATDTGKITELGISYGNITSEYYFDNGEKKKCLLEFESIEEIFKLQKFLNDAIDNII